MLRTAQRARLLVAMIATGVVTASPASAQVIFSENFNSATPSNASYTNGSPIGGSNVTPLTGINFIVPQSAGDNAIGLGAGIYAAQSSFRANGLFNLSAGTSYTMTFSQFVGNFGQGQTSGPWALAVYVGPGTVTYSGVGPMALTDRSFTYTPGIDITNALISFVFFNPEENPTPGYLYNAAFIDDITVTAERVVEEPPASAVPEPSSVALLAAGLAGVGVMARRRRDALLA